MSDTDPFADPGEGAKTSTEKAPDTVAAILKAVGDDPAKAREALVDENVRESPRKTLVEALERVIGEQ